MSLRTDGSSEETRRLLIDEAARVHDAGRLSDRDIAHATGTAPSIVREWLVQRRTPSGMCAERLVELSAIVDRLGRVVSPEHISVWLNEPLEMLAEDTPIERIVAGDHRSVARVISGLEDPGAS